MSYSAMSSPLFDEKAYVSAALHKVYWDYANSIRNVIYRHYMSEIGNDVEKEAAIFESYRNAGETAYISLYELLYFKVDKAIDNGEMDVYYADNDVEIICDVWDLRLFLGIIKDKDLIVFVLFAFYFYIKWTKIIIVHYKVAITLSAFSIMPGNGF